MKLRERHRWFASDAARNADGWFGPHRTVDAALAEAWSHFGRAETIFVGQGRKLTKIELEEMGVEYTWEVDTSTLFEIKLRVK